MNEQYPNSAMLLGIGAVSRACGVPVNTLRTWERRYGFPNPERTSGKHRQYSVAIVERLVLIRQAIEMGHRPRNVVPAPIEELRAITGITPTTPIEAPILPEPTGDPIKDWVRHAKELDEYALDAGLRREQAKMSLEAFVLARIVPFVEELGASWARGELEPFQEHFATERVRDLLASSWRQLERSSRGATVICATLPGEAHSLGLYLTAAISAVRGLRVVFLGGESPVDLILAATAQREARAVLVSISSTSAGPHREQEIRELRAKLPEDTQVIVGGAGAPDGIEGVTTIRDLVVLSQWAETLR